jgi:hypothetical protein
LTRLVAVQSLRVQGTHRVETEDSDLSDDDLLLASTVVYGFSLADKVWREYPRLSARANGLLTRCVSVEFSVQNIQDVVWNEDAFANLVIPSGRKALLQSLVEAHHKELGFDDFIKGKGQGLVINLFGPPGVGAPNLFFSSSFDERCGLGKTFSAEATSEHVKRPLYVVDAGELGTRATELSAALERVFDLATRWKAIVLIDEVRRCLALLLLLLLANETDAPGGRVPRASLAPRH